MDTKIIIKNIKNNSHISDLSKELSKQGYKFNDLFILQVKELFEIKVLDETKRDKSINNYIKNHFGNLILFPRTKNALRILEEKDYLSLLTSRNKNLITESEQNKFYSVKVAIAGLSIGSNIATTLIMQGGCKYIKIADHDELSTSNLNRVRFNLLSVGKNKCEITEENLHLVNPYLEIQKFNDGLDDKNIKDFLNNTDICFDEIDNLGIKLLIRLLAKEKKIPVIMITDNGDNVMIDIERYDLDENLEPFHGLLDKKDQKIILSASDNLSIQEKVILSLKIVQPQNAVPRMQQSLLEVGKSLKTWPQLGTASTFAGAVGSYIVRKISCGDKLKSGRIHFSVDNVLIPNYDDLKTIKEREQLTKLFLAKLSTKK